MCTPVGSQNLEPGWICCKCKIYNGEVRQECKQCDHKYCGKFATLIPRDRLDSMIADLGEIIRATSRLLPKVEAELQRMSFADLVRCMNEIDMPEEAAQQYQELSRRLPAILGVDLAALTEAVVASPATDLPN